MSSKTEFPVILVMGLLDRDSIAYAVGRALSASGRRELLDTERMPQSMEP